LKSFNHLHSFYYLLEAYRSIIIKGSLPDPGIYTVGLVSVLCVFISLFLFGKAINRARDFL